MGKRNKEEPMSDWEVRARALGVRNAQLEEELVARNVNSIYISSDLFVKEYTAALAAYMEAQFGKNARNLHPHDLAASAATFADAWWAIYDNMDFAERRRQAADLG